MKQQCMFSMKFSIKLELQHAKIWRKWIMEKTFWMQFNFKSICMCWKHKTKTDQCHCGIIFFHVGWNCAALVWASIVANLSLSCNRFFLMSSLHDLPLIIKWHLIRKNSALWGKILLRGGGLICPLLKFQNFPLKGGDLISDRRYRRLQSILLIKI